MKRIISLLLAMIIFSFTFPASAKGLELYYDGEYHTYTGTLYKLIVNGKQLEVPLDPITFNNRSLVPIREVYEALGAKVDFVDTTREIIISGNNIDVKMQIDNPVAYVNGKEVTIPDGVAPKLITKVGVVTKTMVPVRFVSEKLGMTVDWSGERGEIIITGSAEEKVTLKTPKITKKNTTTTVITINTNKAIKNAVKASVTAAGVLYFDVENSSYEGASKTEVNHAAVIAVRYGLHEEYTRVAVDMKDYKSYKVETSTDKKQITITVVAKDGTAGESGDNPNEEPDNNETTTPPEEKPINVTVDIEAMKKYNASNGIKYVVIDAGHGGKDSGAVGSIIEVLEAAEENIEAEETAETQPVVKETIYKEKTITLEIAKLVQAQLQAAGVKVIMTRSGDTFPELSERPVIANQNDAAMFVSIHVNSAANAPKANGIEVYYAGKNNHDFYGLTSKELANTVYNKLIAETGATKRGVKTENHWVTRSSLMPAILVEVGFISNEDEIKKLIDPAYQQKLANSISAGILAHIDDVTVPDRRELAEKLVAKEIGEEKAKEYMNEKWK